MNTSLLTRGTAVLHAAGAVAAMAFNRTSDHHAKENFIRVSTSTVPVLNKLITLPTAKGSFRIQGFNQKESNQKETEFTELKQRLEALGKLFATRTKIERSRTYENQNHPIIYLSLHSLPGLLPFRPSSGHGHGHGVYLPGPTQ